MSDLQLYHCEKCNSVFSAPMPFDENTVCSVCGERPLNPKDFNSMDNLEKVDPEEDVHGVAGRDVADFVSMQKVRRRKQARLAVYLWVALLIVGGGVAIYYKQATELKIDRVTDFRNNESIYNQKLREESSKCLSVYDAFQAAGSVNEKSQYVVGGVSKLLKMEAYASGSSRFSPQVPSVILDASYSEDGQYPRVEMILQDAIGRSYELLFWKVGDQWKIDWEHYVRFSESSWNEFLVNRQGSGDFRLYVRQRYGIYDSDDLDLLFYRPSEELGVKLAESPQVKLLQDSPLHAQLVQAFEKNNITAEEREKLVIRSQDLPGFLRVQAKLSFSGDPENPNLQLEEIYKTYWSEFDPNAGVEE